MVPPRFRDERGMSQELIDAIGRLGKPRILVLGDLILDRYTWGDAERVSQEAPVILLRQHGEESRLGGAANVANMLRGLEADVTLAGLVGHDDDGRCLCRNLEQAGIDCRGVTVDPDRPTTTKVRFMGRAQYRHPHQMLRLDREVRTPVSGEIAQQLLRQILPELPQFAAILVSDYGKGVCTPQLLTPLLEQARRLQIPVIADPANGADYQRYRKATGVTPNRAETSKAVGFEVATIEDAFRAGRQLVEQYQLEMAFITLDRDGIVLARRSGSCEHLPTRPREVCDITGAGDMVLAMIGVGMAAGIEPADLSRLANVAGGLEVEQVGVVPLRRSDLLADLLKTTRLSDRKICSRAELVRRVEGRRQAGQSIVFTNGCFDLLHVGHLAYLRQAADEGNCLIVAINSDESVRRLGKAPDRPLFDQNYRAEMLAGLEAVDFVVVFDEDTPHAILKEIRPDVLVKGGTYTEEEIVGREVVLEYGGRVKPLGVRPGVSTTDIVARLRRAGAPSSIPLSAYVPERRAG